MKISPAADPGSESRCYSEWLELGLRIGQLIGDLSAHILFRQEINEGGMSLTSKHNGAMKKRG